MTAHQSMSQEQCAAFEREVAVVINRLSLERYSDTPDHVLAKHLLWALLDFNATMAMRATSIFNPPLLPPAVHLAACASASVTPQGGLVVSCNRHHDCSRAPKGQLCCFDATCTRMECQVRT